MRARDTAVRRQNGGAIQLSHVEIMNRCLKPRLALNIIKDLGLVERAAGASELEEIVAEKNSEFLSRCSHLEIEQSLLKQADVLLQTYIGSQEC